MEKEHLKPEFVALNPQHTVPTLVDDGKVLWDSHAINAYLVSKYGKDDSLYPTEPWARAIVDQRLHFNNSTLFSRFGGLVRPIFFENRPDWDPEAVAKIGEAFDLIEKFLGDNEYIAGKQLTIADFSCAATASTIIAMGIFTEVQFPKVHAWIKRLQQLPYYHEANQVALEKAGIIFRAKLEANKAAA